MHNKYIYLKFVTNTVSAENLKIVTVWKLWLSNINDFKN